MQEQCFLFLCMVTNALSWIQLEAFHDLIAADIEKKVLDSVSDDEYFGSLVKVTIILSFLLGALWLDRGWFQ